ncbi:hypothetical protein [Streptomyces sp. B93]|uniref:hypothetical protein n=1 Tax=Streptomyces sp. B93 TaxID=2824875 RepID=UPI001B35AA0A|nr:hypothetical protein [Streptomyces sp. B93]MBQ1088284.1 hypothetical protein [Streptomyces sp. B93]
MTTPSSPRPADPAVLAPAETGPVEPVPTEPVPTTEPVPAAEPPPRPAQAPTVGEAPAVPARPVAPPTLDPPPEEEADVQADAIGELVHAAVSDRPLEEVVRLVTLLEESPEYGRSVVDVLRAVAVDRPVDDVARLITELTRPPRDPGSADVAIRTAIENRTVEEVSRLMELLHRTPVQPHCGQEAVRAAATGRPVEELVQLIGRLAQERHGVTPTLEAGPGFPAAVPDEAPPVTAGLRPVEVRRERHAERSGRPAFWPSWLAAAALVVCGAAHFPLHRDGVPLRVYAATLAMAGLCVVLAVVVACRATAPVLLAGVLVPAVPAAAVIFEDWLRAPQLSQALGIMVAPPWSAGLTAVCASLASLAALLLLLMVQLAERHPAVARRGTP